MLFTDRAAAGRRLGDRLAALAGRPDVAVLGLPRGGVPVAAAVARALGAPLDLCLVRKLGVPAQPELAMGALGEDGVRVVDDTVVREAGVPPAALERVAEREQRELLRRAARYRGERPALPVAGRTVVLVDDGVATGSTARAACRTVRARGAARTVLAVPVAPPDWTRRLAGEADELVALETPPGFFAVGQFYADFAQLDDADVIACLYEAASGDRTERPGEPGETAEETEAEAGVEVGAEAEVVEVEAGPVRLAGHLTIPAAPIGLVVFAHGSGSGRHSPRNRYVAAGLHRAGLGTLLFDLLTEEEAGERDNVFDTALLAARLTAATAWLRRRPDTRNLPLGCFGASTGAAAALRAAADPAAGLAAVVSRGGRPDLAGPALPAVTAPTLLIVGGADPQVLDLNRQAQTHLTCENRLAVVPGATHLFEEPGTLEQATDLARTWFTTHLTPPTAPENAKDPR
ncbi:phosphoribosyltransferase family protein [Streptomyces sp. PsTaAH-124]|uniref:phosphoribosyltransferase family protein n=1 Tax=Streptomyces sp. PsTaAH-124 TaxID=1157638 RepID=UPI000366BC54|nr:phosphoribosyltransferase family protein [Streptomyces sp. PsTaAH-124]